MPWSEKDSGNLERIADALERLVGFQEQQSVVPLNAEDILDDVSTNSLEADFFHESHGFTLRKVSWLSNEAVGKSHQKGWRVSSQKSTQRSSPSTFRVLR